MYIKTNIEAIFFDLVFFITFCARTARTAQTLLGLCSKILLGINFLHGQLGLARTSLGPYSDC